MNYLRTIIGVLLVLFLVSILYIRSQPSSFVVKRSISTTVPAATLYNYISDLENWQEWNPWIIEDSNIKLSFSDLDSNTPSYQWESPNGNGSIKTIERVHSKKIVQQMDFKEFGSSKIVWNIKTNSDKLEWTMEGNTNFSMKAFLLLSGGIDTLIGPYYQKGLKAIDRIMSTKLNTHRFELKNKDTISPYFYLALTYTTDRVAIDSLWKKGEQILLNYAKEQQLEIIGKAFTLYPRITPEAITWRIGLPISEYHFVTQPQIRCLYIRERPYIKGVHYGLYDKLDLSWESMRKEMEAVNPILQFTPIEYYLVGPQDNPDPLTWRTELIIPYE